MSFDNSEKIKFSPHFMSLEHQLLDASILLDRWSKWAKTFGSLLYDQKDFAQLQEDTKKFFNEPNKKRE